MIYTVTLNPSIDYVVRVANFTEGGMNRSTSESFFAGGKGINVSLVLKEFSTESIALGFIAGFTGEKIRTELKGQGIREKFIDVLHGNSRINIKLKTGFKETEINGQGPDIKTDDTEALYSQLDELKAGDLLVLSGSVPKSVKPTIYRDIAVHLHKKHGGRVRVIIDTSDEALKEAIEAKPYLIKPNHIEVCALLGKEITTDEKVIAEYAEDIRKRGVKNVLVSMADRGAVLSSEDGKSYFEKAPKGDAINSVGAGDSMLAGFIAEYERSRDYSSALKWGIAAGSAGEFSEGLPKYADIEALYRKM